MRLESGPKEGPDDEAIEVYGRADHCGAARAGSGDVYGGCLPQARDQQRDVLCVEGEVRRHGRIRGKRLKQLEEENAKLKRLLADAMLDNVALKDLLSKKF
jgi:hypothetical protein